MMELLADTHVHVHACFDPDAFFDAAADNFDRASGAPTAGDRWDLLCLTDVSGVQADRYLCETLRRTKSWRFFFHADRSAVCAERNDGRRMHVLPGRQIVSKENLEVLALNCRYEAEDHAMDLNALMDGIRQAGGNPVLPWGFGKWAGKRGRVVRALLETRKDFMLADNGNRLSGTPMPALLRKGLRRGFDLLAGSDPLPLTSQVGRVGTYGVRASSPVTDAGPAEAFRTLVSRPGAWTLYGKLTAPAPFVVSQLRMQINKRRKNRS